MRRWWEKLRRLGRDDAGQATLEWVMILCIFGIPLVGLFKLAMDVLCEQYRAVTFLHTLPFP